MSENPANPGTMFEFWVCKRATNIRKFRFRTNTRRGNVKKLEAIIKPYKLDTVKHCRNSIGVKGRHPEAVDGPIYPLEMTAASLLSEMSPKGGNKRR